MRVPDTITLNPVFLGVTESGVQHVAGTRFFIAVASETHADTRHGYLVTARHVVQNASRLGLMFVRINRRRPGVGRLRDRPSAEIAGSVDEAEVIELAGQGQWLFNDDEANDVAVLPMMPPNDYLVVVVAPESMATPSIIDSESIGVGDDLIVTGLFSSHYGRTTNRPIVRSEIIAAMPDEPPENQTRASRSTHTSRKCDRSAD